MAKSNNMFLLFPRFLRAILQAVLPENIVKQEEPVTSKSLQKQTFTRMSKAKEQVVVNIEPSAPADQGASTSTYEPTVAPSKLH